jgi:hypothetical protein
MKPIAVDNLVQGDTYFIQYGNNKFKAVYDRYEKNKWYFKKIIRLNTIHTWCGHIGTDVAFYYKIYEYQKIKIQTAMEARAMNQIFINLIGTPL